MQRLRNLGNLHAEAGELAHAADYYTQALPLIRAVGAYGNEEFVSANLGERNLVLVTWTTRSRASTGHGS